MDVLILSNTTLQGGIHVKAGEYRTISDADWAILKFYRKADLAMNDHYYEKESDDAEQLVDLRRKKQKVKLPEPYKKMPVKNRMVEPRELTRRQ